MNIGDLFLALRAQGAKLEADVVKEATKAGDAGAKTLGQRLGKGMTIGLTAAGAAAGAVFAVAARGAAELTDAMATFQAETGATQEELDSARKSVLELSKTNLQSFDEIAKTQAKLRTDLGLTQAEAEQATDAFLKYGTATGRDAAEGVAALDDILDAWNLDSSKSTEIMDKLVASHQKYGGSLTENEAALNNLAPQLQALNLDVDDGISLLNLFAEGGLDAAKAQFALNSAIKKLPPGTTFEEFVAHLASIEDPAARARAAIEIFGARGGAGLANVIRPGMKGLDDFAVGMDEAAGATERAAEAIENTPLNQLKMALRSIAAPAIEAGQSFGPLIMALSQLGGGKLVAGVSSALGGLAGKLTSKLGPKLQDGLVKAFGGLIIPSKVFAGPLEAGLEGAVGPAVAKAGLGKRIAAAVGTIAIPVVIAFALAEFLQEHHENSIKPEIQRIVDTAVTDGTEAGLRQAIENLRRIAHNVGRADPWVAEYIDSQLPILEQKLGELDGTVEAAAAQVPARAADALERNAPVLTAAASSVIANMSTATKDDAHKGGTLIAGRWIRGFYDGVIEKQSVVKTAIEAAISIGEQTMDKATETAYLIGVLTSEEMANGVNDKRPNVAAAWQAARQAGLDRLKDMHVTTRQIGKDSAEKLADGAKSKNPYIRDTVGDIRRTIEKNIKPNTKPAGAAAGQGVIDGLNSKKGPIGTAAYNLGVNIVARMLAGVRGVAGTGTGPTSLSGLAGGGYAEAGVPVLVGERRPELFVPDVNGHVYPSVQSGMDALGGGAGDTIVHLSTYGLPMYTPTPAEVAASLRRVASVGILRPRRSTTWKKTA